MNENNTILLMFLIVFEHLFHFTMKESAEKKITEQYNEYMNNLLMHFCQKIEYTISLASNSKDLSSKTGALCEVR